MKVLNRIQSVKARKILDSRSDFTVETSIHTSLGTFTGSAPKGGSRGSGEAVELSAQAAVKSVNKKIAPKLAGKNLASQNELDSFLVALDSSENKSNLGANAILSVSIAGCRANAASKKKELYSFLAELSGNKKLLLPVPFLNVLNGGKHADLKNDVQEAMIVPVGFRSFSAALGASTAVFHSLRALLHKKWGASATLVGDEGGFVPHQAKTVEQRLELLEEAVENAGFSKKFAFAIDCAATEFYNSKKKKYFLGKKAFSAGQLSDYYVRLVKSFHLVSIEDGFAQDDWDAWRFFTKKMGKKIQIIGDDLLVTNPARITQGIRLGSCNSLLLKPNQIGTVSESIEAALLAKKAGWKVMVSHRSGETNDSFIADLVVGLGFGQCKFGAPDRGERIAKYNRLLQIEEELGKKARFAKL
ncbi:MAG: phosphopyruvate hydratase [Candidatus Micrarchaeota archaeon]